MTIDLMKLDPATLPAGPEANAVIAELWMKWRFGKGDRHRHYFEEDGTPTAYCKCRGCCDSYVTFIWSPSTNFAHAGEVRRKAGGWELEADEFVDGADGNWQPAIRCQIHHAGCTYIGRTFFRETNGDKGEAEALAICRAILAALQAAEKAKSTE